MEINIGLDAAHRQEVANALQKVLANEMVLYTKLRNYHWNIEGSNFMEMHKFYEDLYGQLAAHIDDTAERIRQLGHYALGRMSDFLKITDLVEEEYTTDQKEQLSHILADTETIIRHLRRLEKDCNEKNRDAGTADFVTGLMEAHEKMAWFVRSYLN